MLVAVRRLSLIPDGAPASVKPPAGRTAATGAAPSRSA